MRTHACTAAVAALGFVAGTTMSSCRKAPPAGITSTTAAAIADAGGELVVSRRTDLARVESRALAVDDTRVYFGDSAADELLAVPKTGGTPSVIGRPAPVAIALGSRSVDWIGTDGAIWRATPDGGTKIALAQGGLFNAIASTGIDTFVAVQLGSSGALARLSEHAIEPLATFDEVPRALAVEPCCAYVVTPHTLIRVSLLRAGTTRLATGDAFAGIAMDEGSIYTTGMNGPTRVLFAIPKGGGSSRIVERSVREAPIAINHGDAYFFDGVQPELRRVSIAGGAFELVASLRELASVGSLVVDDTGIFVATTGRDDAVVVSLPRPELPR